MEQNYSRKQEWEHTAPYTRMLECYTRAAERVQVRREALKAELRGMQCNKRGTFASARAQMLLERRIAVLRDELEDLEDAIVAIRPYAEKEPRA